MEATTATRSDAHGPSRSSGWRAPVVKVIALALLTGIAYALSSLLRWTRYSES